MPPPPKRRGQGPREIATASTVACRRTTTAPRRIYRGKPFRQSLRDLGLTPNQVWGLTKTDEAWSTVLEAALTTTRRNDLEHGTNAAYVQGCVCSECREHQRERMAKNRG